MDLRMQIWDQRLNLGMSLSMLDIGLFFAVDVSMISPFEAIERLKVFCSVEFQVS